MSTSNFDTIISRVRATTSDANGIYWPKDDLISFINEGQFEYCQKTKTLRAEAPLTSQENNHIYNLPTDCIEADYVERGDGKRIYKTTVEDLDRMFGPMFRRATGDPLYFYHSLDGQKQIRFYPTPTEDQRATWETFDADLGVVTGSEEDGVVDDYDGEAGEIVDGNGAYDTFDFDAGIVTGTINSDGALRVYYYREPREDQYEINDLQALQYYCLHKCYEKEGPFRDLNLSMHYEMKFQERVNEESNRMESGQHANMSVRGYYE